jgi:hypothetical protein
MRLKVDTKKMVLTCFLATGKQLLSTERVTEKEWLSVGSIELAPLPAGVEMRVGVGRYYGSVTIVCREVMQTFAGHTPPGHGPSEEAFCKISAAPPTDQCIAHARLVHGKVAGSSSDDDAAKAKTTGGAGAATKPKTRARAGLVPMGATIGTHGFLNGDDALAFSLCYEEKFADQSALQAEMVNTMRLALDNESAVRMCEEALAAATSQDPPSDVCSLALGVLHTLGAEAEQPRRGAFGTHA